MLIELISEKLSQNTGFLIPTAHQKTVSRLRDLPLIKIFLFDLRSRAPKPPKIGFEAAILGLRMNIHLGKLNQSEKINFEGKNLWLFLAPKGTLRNTPYLSF